jgi:hypothetical protein
MPAAQLPVVETWVQIGSLWLCRLQQGIARKQKSPAGLRQGFGACRKFPASLLQVCGKVSKCWKVSCRFATRFPSVGKSPASLRQGFQVLESLLQVCDKVSKCWKVSCIVTAKNSKKRERGIKDFELVV